MSKTIIIYVPGIQPKPEPSLQHDGLWRCLLAGIRRVSPGVADEIAREPDSFRVVSWTYAWYGVHRDMDLDRAGLDRLLDGGESSGDLAEARRWGIRFQRLLYRAADQIPFLIPLVANRHMEVKLRDTRRYFRNEGGMAHRIRGMLTEALNHAWRRDQRVMLIGHSMGSIIAWDTLWKLCQEADPAPGPVDLFVSMGSPLGLHYVRNRLLSAGRRGADAYPSNIRRWVNLSAMGDMTSLGVSFGAVFADMVRRGLVEEILEQNDLLTRYRGPEGLNVHKCYGYMASPVTGRVVADWWQSRSD